VSNGLIADEFFFIDLKSKCFFVGSVLPVILASSLVFLGKWQHSVGAFAILPAFKGRQDRGILID